MSDLTVDQRLDRLEAVSFPGGVLSSDDLGMSITPAPTSVQQGERSGTYQILGLAPEETVTLYSSPESIGKAVSAGPRGFVLIGENAGPAGARTQISVQRSNGPGIVFFLDVTPIPRVVEPPATDE